MRLNFTIANVDQQPDRGCRALYRSVYCLRCMKCISASQHQSNHSAAATVTTNSTSNDAYQELNMMPPSEHVYNQPARH